MANVGTSASRALRLLAEFNTHRPEEYLIASREVIEGDRDPRYMEPLAVAIIAARELVDVIREGERKDREISMLRARLEKLGVRP